MRFGKSHARLLAAGVMLAIHLVAAAGCDSPVPTLPADIRTSRAHDTQAEAEGRAAPNQVLGLENQQPPPSEIRLYFDVSVSILGYIPAARACAAGEAGGPWSYGTLVHFLGARLPCPAAKVVINEFGAEVRNISTSPCVKRPDKAYARVNQLAGFAARPHQAYGVSKNKPTPDFHKTSRLDLVLREVLSSAPDALSVVVTDLYLYRSGGGGLSEPITLMSRYLRRPGACLALVAVRSRFEGKVYDVPGVPAFKYDGQMPFYILIAGRAAHVRALLADLEKYVLSKLRRRQAKGAARPEPGYHLLLFNKRVAGLPRPVGPDQMREVLRTSEADDAEGLPRLLSLREEILAKQLRREGSEEPLQGVEPVSMVASGRRPVVVGLGLERRGQGSELSAKQLAFSHRWWAYDRHAKTWRPWSGEHKPPLRVEARCPSPSAQACRVRFATGQGADLGCAGLDRLYFYEMSARPTELGFAREEWVTKWDLESTLAQGGDLAKAEFLGTYGLAQLVDSLKCNCLAKAKDEDVAVVHAAIKCMR